MDLMTEDEYLLAQCRQHGYNPNLIDEVKLGRTAGQIFDRPKIKPAGVYEPPKTESIVQIHNAESKHNKVSANCTPFAHIKLACVLNIIITISDALLSRLFPDKEHANHASALEILQALETRFATLCATNIVKITIIFYAPYDTAGTIGEYL